MKKIDLAKVRKWVVNFRVQQPLLTLPCPAHIVEEVEDMGYRIPAIPVAERPPMVRGGQLTVTLGGRGRLRVGSETFNLKPGQAFLYRINDARIRYEYPPDGTADWHFVWIHFNGPGAESMIAELNEKYGFVYDLPPGNRLAECLLDYKKYAGTVQFLSPLEAGRMAVGLLELLVQGPEQRQAHSPYSRLVREVQRLISLEPERKWTGESLAREAGVSREHLLRIFKQQYGSTLHDYLLELRLHSAWELLLRTSLPCKEIVERCGFSSYSGFFRAFRQKFGCSPEELRGRSV